MLATYRAVFRAPGSAAFCAAGFVMRLPIAIYPIAMVLLISLRTHQYGFAGILSAAYIIGGAPGNPVCGRLVDRFGQSRVLPWAATVHIASVLTLVALAETHCPDWTLLAPAFVAGFSYLPVGSLVRARWSYVLAGRPELSTAYSLESTLDELIFVLGPLIATVLATTISPLLPLILAVVFVGVGSCWLATLRATEPPLQRDDGHPRRSALSYRGMPLVVFAAVAMGAVFASAELTMIAFCGQHSAQSLSGAVLAMFAFGSGVAGFVYGSRTWNASIVWRFRLQALIFAVLPLIFLAATNVLVLAICAFVVGLGIAPTLITCFGLIAEIVPNRSLTEGLSWLTTGLNVGYGAGAALVGRIADEHGARVAFSVTIVSAVLVGLTALWVYGVLRHPEADVEDPVLTP